MPRSGCVVLQIKTRCMTGQVEHHKATQRTNVPLLSWPTGLFLLSLVSSPLVSRPIALSVNAYYLSMSLSLPIPLSLSPERRVLPHTFLPLPPLPLLSCWSGYV